MTVNEFISDDDIRSDLAWHHKGDEGCGMCLDLCRKRHGSGAWAVYSLYLPDSQRVPS